MRHIAGPYYIDADRYQWILKIKREKQIKKDGKVVGTGWTFDDSYHATLGQVLFAAGEHKAKALVAFLVDLKAILDGLREWADALKSPLVGDLKAAVADHEKNLATIARLEARVAELEQREAA